MQSIEYRYGATSPGLFNLLAAHPTETIIFGGTIYRSIKRQIQLAYRDGPSNYGRPENVRACTCVCVPQPV